MKSYRPDVQTDPLVEVLCKHFRIDPKVVTYVEKIEMIYIYNYIRERFQTSDPAEIFGEIKKLQAAYKMRSKRKRLYRVFFQCKITTMTSSGRYDTTTIKLPLNHTKGRYY